MIPTNLMHVQNPPNVLYKNCHHWHADRNLPLGRILLGILTVHLLASSTANGESFFNQSGQDTSEVVALGVSAQFPTSSLTTSPTTSFTAAPTPATAFAATAIPSSPTVAASSATLTPATIPSPTAAAPSAAAVAIPSPAASSAAPPPPPSSTSASSTSCTFNAPPTISAASPSISSVRPQHSLPAQWGFFSCPSFYEFMGPSKNP
eukprot:jgi/Botrbrau1/1980/Bobra.0052s0023.1